MALIECKQFGQKRLTAAQMKQFVRWQLAHKAYVGAIHRYFDGEVQSPEMRIQYIQEYHNALNGVLKFMTKSETNAIWRIK
jgi:hypothetical protein